MPFAAFKSGEAAGTRAMSVSPQSPSVVAICGEVDIQSAPELREEFLRVIRRRGPQLIIDLGGVTFVDCAGLSMLLATRRRAQLEGGWVRLVEVPPQARRMISLLNLDRAFGLGTLGRPRSGRPRGVYSKLVACRCPCDFHGKVNECW